LIDIFKEYFQLINFINLNSDYFTFDKIVVVNFMNIFTLILSNINFVLQIIINMTTTITISIIITVIVTIKTHNNHNC